MNIAIDSGNSNTKLGFFHSGELQEIKVVPNREFYNISIPEAENIIISSVSSIDFNNITASKNVLRLSQNTPLPIKVNYNTPQSLGTDRIAAVTGTRFYYPDTNALVINAGTCLTTDFIDCSNVYQGGSISPGINMRFEALNKFTARLPLISTKKEFSLTGKSTEDSIVSGIQNGILAEVEQIISLYHEKYPDCRIFLTGGDSFFFETNLKASIFAVSELVILGLNSILEYNVSKA